MGFYSRVVFPRLCDWLLDQPHVAKLRREVLAGAGGEVLEIGFGTGLNLPYYPKQVRKLITVDPNAGMNALAQRRIRDSGVEVDHRVQSGEQLPFETGRFDCVVSTFTLCSIPEVIPALAEVYRVLAPRGRFLFLEHGLSPDPQIQKWQRRLNRLEGLLADGCRLDLHVRELIAAQPFSASHIEEQYVQQMPRTHGYLYLGFAAK